MGAVATTATILRQQINDSLQTVDQRPELADRWGIWREEKRSRRNDNTGSGINSACIFNALSRLVSENAIIAVDVGNNIYSLGRYFECTR